MQADEVDVALDELETRLERLRALYEQYFLGIEKLEPSVARKDVDRRIWLLRREKIRNTAKRFKLQTIIQRYNTFQQYWQRILREIEAGTYRRHVLRAEKQFGNAALTIAARKRAGMFRRGEEAAEARSTAQAAASAAASPEAANEQTPPAPETPIPAPPVVPPTIVPSPVRPILGRLDLDFGELSTAPAAARTSAPAAQRPGPPPVPKRPTAPPAHDQPPARAQSPAPAEPAAHAESPAKRPAPAAAPAPGPTAPGGLSDQRIKELHARLIVAKRETNDVTSVSVDGLARSLREAEKRLKAEHGDRSIDFDVVIKGGKALVKPIVK